MITDLQLLLAAMPEAVILLPAVFGAADLIICTVMFFLLLNYKIQRDVQVVMADEQEILLLLQKDESLIFKPFSPENIEALSLLPLTDCNEVTLQGVQWNLEYAPLLSAHPYAISNMVEQEKVVFTCNQGRVGFILNINFKLGDGRGENFGNFRSKYDCFFIVSRIYSRIYRFNCWRRRFNFYAGITGPRVACNFALGTNKLAASMGGLMSVFSFWRAGKINQKVAISLMPLSFLGSALGAYVVYLLPEQLMKNVIVVLLVAVAVYTYRRKDGAMYRQLNNWDWQPCLGL